MPTEPQQRRRYESPLRAAQAEQTRTAILAAATELLETRGWNGTGMRDVAKAAQVSIETVYAAFGSKAVLLKQALDVAVVGDAAPVPLADREVFRRLFEGAPLERAEAAAQVLIDVRLRTARLRRVLNQAVGADPQLEEVQQETHASERESIRQAAVAVGGRDVSDEDVDALFATLSTEVFLLLTDTCGWPISAYQSWTVQIIRFVLNLDGAN
jgi:AcrR family transcriptional regulator